MIRHHTLRAVGVIFFCGVAATAAHSQSNELRIDQNGAGNSLTVDQSAASGSRVGGAGFLHLASGGAPTSLLALDGSKTAAVDEAGRSLFSSSAPPALQIGSGNQASIVVRGAGNGVILEQRSADSAPLASGNRATIQVDSSASSGVDSSSLSRIGSFEPSGIGSLSQEASSAIASDFAGSSAYVIQQGQSNLADVNVSGRLSSGGAVQVGDRNSAHVGVVGDGVSGSVFQLGNDNAASLAVRGTPGTGVSYNLIGNSIQGAQPSVVTNGATVVITQTNFGQ